MCNHWWQTELAAPAIGFLPREAIRPDCSGTAFGPLAFSIRDVAGKPLSANRGGLLVLESPAPQMFHRIWGDDARKAQYFTEIADVYTAGDVATIDDDGYVTVLGRADDVLNVAGHRSRRLMSRARLPHIRRAVKPA